MTYIEFFDKSAAENIAACLTRAPDRVIYIGDNTKIIKKHIEYYKKVFENRGKNIEFIYKSLNKNNLESVVKLLSSIVEAYDDCVFDITGGDEIGTLALGIVYSRYPEKNIQIQRFNLRNGKIFDCDKDGMTIFEDEPQLSVDENIVIYGGSVVYGDVDGQDTYKWNLNPEFLEDISLIWDICKYNISSWNKQLSDFAAMEEVGKPADGGLTTIASKTALEFCSLYSARHSRSMGIINKLLRLGLLTQFEDDEGRLIISYKNKQVKRCLTKAGQALEMKIFVTAKGLTDSNGLPVYNDVLNGVVIDWDGKVHDDSASSYDTENEIDVLLMHGTVPVFISCKNGIVTSDELYKLQAVAERFGGKYSKKVLIATSINDSTTAGRYLYQRAEDMGIRIMNDIHEMSDTALAKSLKNLWVS